MHFVDVKLSIRDFFFHVRTTKSLLIPLQLYTTSHIINGFKIICTLRNYWLGNALLYVLYPSTNINNTNLLPLNMFLNKNPNICIGTSGIIDVVGSFYRFEFHVVVRELVYKLETFLYITQKHTHRIYFFDASISFSSVRTSVRRRAFAPLSADT